MTIASCGKYLCGVTLSEQVVLGLTTFYGIDENSNLRIGLFCKTLEKARRLGLNVVVFDGGSTHPKFSNIIAEYADNLDIHCGMFSGLGDQTRKLIEYTKNQYPERYIFRTEPEKYGLLTEENLGAIVQKAQEYPNASYVSPTRDLENSKLPKPLALAEASVGRQVNVLMQSKDGANFQEIHDGSKSEGPGSLFGPILITKDGIDAILSSDDVAWGTWLFPRILAEMEGKSRYLPVLYDYDEQEIRKENTDMRKLWKFCKGENILDAVRVNLKEGRVGDAINLIQESPRVDSLNLKDNLAFKRLEQYIAMLSGLTGVINSK